MLDCLQGDMDMTDEIEQRRGYVDIERIINELAESVREQGRQIHANDREIAVLQAQVRVGAERTTAIECAIKAIHDKIDELSECFSRKLDIMVHNLADHTKQEDKDRIKLLLAVVATLATGLASLAFELFRR
jgi:DNA polymerase II small subunit/DNA polymerase delta subunit B